MSGRHVFDAFTYRPPKGTAGWIDGGRCEWTIVVGDRIRRLRRDRNLTLVELARMVEKPRGGTYSPGYISRVERGWASTPLSTYLAIAGALRVAPWRLLGPEEVQKDVTDAELTLILFLRRLEMAPDEVLARVATAPPAPRPARAGEP